MTFYDMIGPSPYDSDPDVDTSFEPMYSVVLSVVHHMYPGTIGPADEDDIANETAFKVWRYWETNPIDHPWAFISLVVRSVKSDMYRKFNPSLYQDFPRDESGNINESLLPSQDASLEADPEWVVLQDENYAELIDRVAGAIKKLEKRQRQAAICTSKKRLDEWSRLAIALEEREIDTTPEWPENPTEKQCLQASFSPAKRKIAQYLGEDLSQYKHSRRSSKR